MNDPGAADAADDCLAAATVPKAATADLTWDSVSPMPVTAS